MAEKIVVVTRITSNFDGVPVKFLSGLGSVLRFGGRGWSRR
jgi:hypothetical protein